MVSVRWLRTALISAVTAWSSIATSFAQDARTPGCTKCQAVGSTECKEHRGVTLEQERAVQFCSVAAACRKCSGALDVDCPKCERAELEAALEERRALVARWLEGRRASVDRFCKSKSLEHLRTPFFDLSFGLAGTTIDKKTVDPHRRMHLYGERLEIVRSRFCEVLGLSAADFPSETEDSSTRIGVHMFADARDQREMTPRLTGIGVMGNNVKLTGGLPVWVVLEDPRSMPKDVDLHRVVVHNVVHLLISNFTPVKELGLGGDGWVDEGLAHWFEMEIDGRCSAYCVEEATIQPGTNWRNGRYRSGIRQLLETGQIRKFVAIHQKNSEQLELEEHAHAFAFVDFLITTKGGPAMADFVRRLKSGEAQRDALKAAFGITPLTFDDAFHAFVRERYPEKETAR
ncbi:MAG: hypothetical protein AB7I19_02700 [Planctomycetota bacterium]